MAWAHVYSCVWVNAATGPSINEKFPLNSTLASCLNTLTQLKRPNPICDSQLFTDPTHRRQWSLVLHHWRCQSVVALSPFLGSLPLSPTLNLTQDMLTKPTNSNFFKLFVSIFGLGFRFWPPPLFLLSSSSSCFFYVLRLVCYWFAFRQPQTTQNHYNYHFIQNFQTHNFIYLFFFFQVWAFFQLCWFVFFVFTRLFVLYRFWNFLRFSIFLSL